MLVPWATITPGLLATIMFAPRIAPYYSEVTGWGVQQSVAGFSSLGFFLPTIFFAVLGGLATVITGGCNSDDWKEARDEKRKEKPKKEKRASKFEIKELRKSIEVCQMRLEKRVHVNTLGEMESELIRRMTMTNNRMDADIAQFRIDVEKLQQAARELPKVTHNGEEIDLVELYAVMQKAYDEVTSGDKYLDREPEVGDKVEFVGEIKGEKYLSLNKPYAVREIYWGQHHDDLRICFTDDGGGGRDRSFDNDFKVLAPTD